MKSGDKVRKIKGYPFDGTVLGTFITLAGLERIVVESDAIQGLLHIFAPEQFELLEGKE